MSCDQISKKHATLGPDISGLYIHKQNVLDDRFEQLFKASWVQIFCLTFNMHGFFIFFLFSGLPGVYYYYHGVILAQNFNYVWE